MCKILNFILIAVKEFLSRHLLFKNLAKVVKFQYLSVYY